MKKSLISNHFAHHRPRDKLVTYYLADIDRQAEELFLRLVKQMADAEGITETLKANDQMEWVRRMNNVRSRAFEIVEADIIYT